MSKNLERQRKRRKAREEKKKVKQDARVEATKTPAQKTEAAAEKSLTDSLQAIQARLVKGIVALKQLHKESKGTASVPLAEVINLFDAQWKLVEFMWMSFHNINNTSYTTALTCMHKLQSLCKALQNKEVVSKEEVEKAHEEILEEAKKLAEEEAAAAFDEAVAGDGDENDDEAPARTLPTAMPQPEAKKGKIIQLPHGS